jgi:hypothetical protein
VPDPSTDPDGELIDREGPRSGTRLDIFYRLQSTMVYMGAARDVCYYCLPLLIIYYCVVYSEEQLTT